MSSHPVSSPESSPIRAANAAVVAPSNGAPTSGANGAFGTEGVLPALDDVARDALLAALEDVVARPADHLHVEPGGESWRLRHRQGDVLSETRLEESSELPAALAALARHLFADVPQRPCRHGAFRVRLADGPRLVELRAWHGAGGEAYTLTPHGRGFAPPPLDALVTDPAILRTLRRLLATPPRWLPIGSFDPVGGAGIVRAIAQELAAPDVRLVCLEPRFHPPLPGIRQLRAADVRDAAPAHEADTVLIAAAPSDAVLAALAADGARAVQYCSARRPSDVLARLLAFAPSPSWVALSVPAFVMRHRVRLVCTRCRLGAPPDCDDHHRLELLRAPRVQDVADWLERSMRPRYRAGEGCPLCHGTAHTGLRDVVEIIEVDARLRHALLVGDVDAAMRRCDDTTALASCLSRLVGNGEITAAEATRHLRPRG